MLRAMERLLARCAADLRTAIRGPLNVRAQRDRPGQSLQAHAAQPARLAALFRASGLHPQPCLIPVNGFLKK
jgi:hypothetical protein